MYQKKQNMTEIESNIEIPKGVESSTIHSELFITRKWFSMEEKVFSLMIISLSIIILYWDFYLFSIGIDLLMQEGNIIALIPFIFFGAALTYYVAAGYFNKTYIRINKNQLSLIHGPLPCISSKKLLINDIKTVCFIKKSIRSHLGTSTVYSVDVILKTGKPVGFISNLHAPRQALFIEQEVKKHLSAVL